MADRSGKDRKPRRKQDFQTHCLEHTTCLQQTPQHPYFRAKLLLDFKRTKKKKNLPAFSHSFFHFLLTNPQLNITVQQYNLCNFISHMNLVILCNLDDTSFQNNGRKKTTPFCTWAYTK